MAQQPNYGHLLGPRLQMARNAFEKGESINRVKFYFFGSMTVVFWVGMFLAGLFLLGKLAAEEPFGMLLVHKLLSFLFMIFFAVLTFSNIVISINSHFLSDDLAMLFSAPVAVDRLFLSRTIQAGAMSSWMVMLFAVPIMLAAGVVFDSPMWYYPWMVLTLAIFLLLPASLGSLVTTLLVKAFPARKTQDVLIIVAIVFVVMIYFLVRFLQPEQLFNPDLFHGFSEYFATLRAPDSPLIPSVWATEALWAALEGKLTGNALFMAGFGLSTGLLGFAFAAWFADRWYFDAFSKSQEGRKARFTSAPATNKTLSLLLRYADPMRRMIMIKDIKSFFRETTQWTQLLLLLALIVVYLFNFKVLKLDRFVGMDFRLRNIIAYANLILASFVLSAVCVRFLLPSVSTEGRAFWILNAAPLRMRDVVMAKFGMFVAPIVLIGQMLVLISNHFLRTHPFLNYYTSILMFLMSIAISAMAVGIGAIMPNFTERNVARMATGASSIVYMVAAMFMVLTVTGLAVLPGWYIFKSVLSHEAMTTGQIVQSAACGVLAIIVLLLTTIFPLKYGIRQLGKREG